MKFVCFITVQNNIYISTECVRSTVSANGPHSDTILCLNECSYKYSCLPINSKTPTASVLNLVENVIMAFVKLPCYVPTTVKYYPFSHLLVFVSIFYLRTYEVTNQVSKKHNVFTLENNL